VIEFPADAVLRVYRFRAPDSEPGLDDAMRDRVVPCLRAAPGIRAVYGGRRGTGQEVERAVVSVWNSGGTDTSPPMESSAIAGSVALVAGASVDVLPLSVGIAVDRRDRPRILRIFRGHVREGQRDRYVAEARNGALADADTNEGLVAVYLATEPPTRFITVSVWTDWSAIELATGGDIRHPMATRNAHLIEAGDATHYEMFAGG
jgi:hypothetical protein